MYRLCALSFKSYTLKKSAEINTAYVQITHILIERLFINNSEVFRASVCVVVFSDFSASVCLCEYNSFRRSGAWIITG